MRTERTHRELATDSETNARLIAVLGEMAAVRTQVGIIGAGPAGLVLAHLLRTEGIESVVVESRSREEIETTIRAGVLEQGTIDLMNQTGVGERLKGVGAFHHGIEIRFAGESHRIDFERHTKRCIALYPQHEFVKDFVAVNLDQGVPILFNAAAAELTGLTSTTPTVMVQTSHSTLTLECDFVAGCDGFHGVSRPALPAAGRNGYESILPFGWLGILVEAPPSAPELIYTRSERGFSLISTRSPEIQRMYIQVDASDPLHLWPDQRIWDELHARTDLPEKPPLIEGRIMQKSIVSMRSFVGEPMQHGRLFLLGDAAHIIPATGAKGLNLAVTDAVVLARGLSEYYRQGRTELLERYTEICLRRTWKTQRFSLYMTNMLHNYPDRSPFDERIQLAELSYLVSSDAAMTSLAENYTGIGIDW